MFSFELPILATRGELFEEQREEVLKRRQEIKEAEPEISDLFKDIIEADDPDKLTEDEKDDIIDAINIVTSPDMIPETEEYLAKQSKEVLLTILLTLGGFVVIGTSGVILQILVFDALNKADREVKQK